MIAFVKFVGLTQEAAEAIERKRQRADESESEIVARELGSRSTPSGPVNGAGPPTLDFGQGIKLPMGQELYLFLSKTDAQSGRIAATGKVRAAGVEVGGRLFERHRGSYLQRPMKLVQERLNHRNAAGELLSLSAYQQWHVKKNGEFVPLDDLKDEKLRRRRRPTLDLSLDDIDLS